MIEGARRAWRDAGRLPVAALLAALLGIVGPAAADVLTYHGSPDRSGLYVTPSLTLLSAPKIKLDPLFQPPAFSGQVFAQPLYWVPPKSTTGMVIVATEQDMVYAFNATTGARIWAATLGTPVPLAALPCGNIDPTGITGTPVIDPVGQVVYLDALVMVAGQPRHQLFGLSLATGAVAPGWPIDVATGLAALGKGFDVAPQGQRSALAIVGGRLYVPFAGRFGDCQPYHGWTVGFELAKPGLYGAWSTRGPGGGSWGASGIAYDGSSMFMTTGNTFSYAFSGPQPAWDDGEAVIRLSPSLANATNPKDYFAPANWVLLNESDLDLGGTSAIPIDIPTASGPPLPRILAMGKDGNAYLLDRSNLGGIGGALVVASAATAEIITAMATYSTPSAAMVAYRAGNRPLTGTCTLGMVSITATSFLPAWCAELNGTGAPIITTSDGKSNAIVWVVGSEGDLLLHGYDAATGSPVYTGTLAMGGLARNATIAATAHRFYIAGNSTVYAYSY